MKKTIIIAAILCLSGFIVGAVGFALAGFDFALLNTSEYITKEHPVKEDFDNITVLTQACDVTLAFSDDGECRIVTVAPEKTQFTVESENGSLAVREKDTRKWYEFIGINIGRSSVTVYLPKTEYGVLAVESDTGDVSIPRELSFESAKLTSDTGVITASSDITESLTVETDTGDVKVYGISAKDLWLDTDTGNIEVTDSVVEQCISAESDTGDIRLKDTKCGNILMDNGTGDIVLADTVVSVDAHLSTDTGEILLDKFDAKDIFAETSTGDITGTVLSDKTFFAESDTGKIDVPHCLSTDTFEAKSSTGDIRISIEK